ncbi:MAG: flavin reductase family protein [Anaerolineae bacterium]
MPAKIARTRCFRPVYPTPAALVTSVAADGTPNIITLGEVFNISIEDPVIVGLAIHPRRYSNELIRLSGEFVVNFPTIEIADLAMACGGCSGRSVDKFALTGLTPLPASMVKAPLIAECPVNLECRLLSVTTIGDHDLFTGEVLVQRVDQDVLRADGSIDPGKLRGFAFVLGEFRALGDVV